MRLPGKSRVLGGEMLAHCRVEGKEILDGTLPSRMTVHNAVAAISIILDLLGGRAS